MFPYLFILLMAASWLSSLSLSGPAFSTTEARPLTSPPDLGVDVWNSPEAASIAKDLGPLTTATGCRF